METFFQDATAVMNGLRRAKEYGLQYEFMASFLQFYKSDVVLGNPIQESITSALKEWDL
jgi:hypothetical protein